MLFVSVLVWCVHTCVHVHGGQRRRLAVLSYPSVFSSQEISSLTEPGTALVASKPQRSSCPSSTVALGFELRPTCLHSKITLSYLCSPHLNFWDRISSLNLELDISARELPDSACLCIPPLHWGYICVPPSQSFISVLVIPTESFLLV